MQDSDPFIINTIIKQRRSVKPPQFVQGKPVPDEIIKQALYNATWAPTHAKTEPWYFEVFTGQGLKKLADFQSEFYKSHAGEKYAEAKYQKLKTEPLLCSHIIAICMKRAPHVKIPELEEIEAVACAVQNLWLTISAYGYGGYWSTGGITYYAGAKSFFGLGEQDHLLGFFSIGVPELQPEPFLRKPIEMISKWITGENDV